MSCMAAGLVKFYPEIGAGGFARNNGGVQFYGRVNALLEPRMTVVDLGAGRGTAFHTGVDSYYERLLRLQGKVARVIGIDVDAGILDHPYLDERHVIDAAAPLPCPENSVDLVVADWVLEHVQDPAHVAREIDRVLKPGGWFCARTPNRWGYVGMMVRLTPNANHKALLRHLQRCRSAEDVFPTVYRLNSVRDLRRYFSADRWRHCSYRSNPSPKYFGESASIFRSIALYQALMPDPFKTDLHVFLQKLPNGESEVSV
jgi:SAM-dependent methyltransferase